jgi:hypothetical protein
MTFIDLMTYDIELKKNKNKLPFNEYKNQTID